MHELTLCALGFLLVCSGALLVVAVGTMTVGVIREEIDAWRKR